MSTDVLQKYITDGIQALERMEETSRCGNAISQELLMQLIRKNQDTAYGQKYGFREIRSYADMPQKCPSQALRTMSLILTGCSTSVRRTCSQRKMWYTLRTLPVLPALPK